MNDCILATVKAGYDCIAQYCRVIVIEERVAMERVGTDIQHYIFIPWYQWGWAHHVCKWEDSFSIWKVGLPHRDIDNIYTPAKSSFPIWMSSADQFASMEDMVSIFRFVFILYFYPVIAFEPIFYLIVLRTTFKLSLVCCAFVLAYFRRFQVWRRQIEGIIVSVRFASSELVHERAPVF